MERLIEIKTHVTGFCYADKKEGVFVQDVFAKLAAYEDTGLTPEEIKALTAGKDQQAKLLEEAKEEIQNCYGRDTDLTSKIDALLGGAE